METTAVKAKGTVLVVEDDALVRFTLEAHLRDQGYTVLSAEDGTQGWQVFRGDDSVEVVLLDLRLPGLDGLELLRRIRKAAPETPVIIVSGMGTFSDVVESLRAGARDYVTKPITDLGLIDHAVAQALDWRNLVRENQCYRRRLEAEVARRTEELHQAQKLEMIGVLAGGVAHDFNNLLGAILGYAELSLFVDEDPRRIRDNLFEIQRAGERAANLVRQLLHFSRPGETRHRPVCIAPVIKEALKLLRATLPTSVEIRQSVPLSDLRILADPTEMHQVIMNLCTNAFQALPREKGVIEVTLEPVTLTRTARGAVGRLEPGPHLRLTVRDDGCGMDGRTKAQIFEPFFTTKERGRGTGLGLCVVHDIVTGSGGCILVDSEPGRGTRVEVYFPVVSGGDPDEPDLDRGELPRGEGRLLLVEDEPALLALLRRMLAYLGYEVESAANGYLAKSRFLEAPAGYRALVTNLFMSGKTGVELIEELHELRPDLPVLLLSGNDRADLLAAVEGRPNVSVLAKPVTLTRLAMELRNLLQAAEGTAAQRPTA